MSGRYVSKREKVRDFIESNIIPVIEKVDIDYNKTVDLIAFETLCSKKIVIEMLDGLLTSKRLRRLDDGTITIPDDKLPSFLERLKSEEKIREEEKKKIEEKLMEFEDDKGNNRKKDRSSK